MTGNSEMHLKGFLFCCVILLTGCTSLTEVNTPASACGPRQAEADAQLAPEMHYRQMQSCLKAGQMQRALDHFTLAGTGTWYDAQIRPGETTLKRHHELLQSSLSQLDAGMQEQTWNEFSIMMKNRKQLADVCSYVQSVAVKRRQIQVFDDLAWEQAREGYMHCTSGEVK